MERGQAGWESVQNRDVSPLQPLTALQSLSDWYTTCFSLDNLIQRYEEPSSMVRWDSPLITVLWEDEVPVHQIWKACMEGNVKPPNAGTQAVCSRSACLSHFSNLQYY